MKKLNAQSKDKDERLYGLVALFVEREQGTDTPRTRELQQYAEQSLNHEAIHGRQKIIGVAA